MDEYTEDLLTGLSPWNRIRFEEFLAAESPALRELRGEAQNPNTPADRLEAIAIAARSTLTGISTLTGYQPAGFAGLLTLSAVARHPNTPPARLLNLLKVCTPAFCRNPVAPFLLLENPGFARWLYGMSNHGAARFLREESAPLPLVRAIAALPNLERTDREAIRSHVGLAGEIQSRDEWESEVRRCWSAFCTDYAPTKSAPRSQNRRSAQMHCDLAEIGFVPPWAKAGSCWTVPSAPPVLPEVAWWLRFPFAPDAPGTHCLWRRVAPHLSDHPELARLAHRQASEADLVRLLASPGVRTGALRQIAALHPCASVAVLASLDNPAFYKRHRLLRLFVARPDCPVSVLTKLVASDDAQVRRLARRHPNAPPNARALSREAVIRFVERVPKTAPTHFVHFAVGLHQGLRLPQTAYDAVSPFWGLRLLAALILPVGLVDPYPNHPFANRYTTHLLLQHLARDGNRLVRWAAQTRLADPNFVFSWDDATGRV